MPIYDITYSTFGQQILPPDKRSARLIAFVTCLLAPMQWLRDLWMGSYRTGDNSPQWASGTYAKYNRVQYGKQVWESAINGNTSTPGADGNWVLVQNNFIGLSERLVYGGQTIVLTWALNKWFGTSFRQPPGTSDIYIVNNSPGVVPFQVGAVEGDSSVFYSNTSPQFIVNDYSFSTRINFTIYFPTSTYNAIAPVDAHRQPVIRSFVDKYIPAGIIYQIQTY